MSIPYACQLAILCPESLPFESPLKVSTQGHTIQSTKGLETRNSASTSKLTRETPEINVHNSGLIDRFKRGQKNDDDLKPSLLCELCLNLGPADPFSST